MKLQYKDEHVGSNALHSSKEDVYAGLPFKLIREEIIKSYAPALGTEAIARLSNVTRGLNRADILQAVDAYILSGYMPEQPAHATNTCDPITGSWTERLLTIEDYRKLYNEAGFNLSVSSGFYNEWQGGFKSIILRKINKIIRVLRTKGRLVTPFITLTGGER
jgi:hypothetical protein